MGWGVGGIGVSLLGAISGRLDARCDMDISNRNVSAGCDVFCFGMCSISGLGAAGGGCLCGAVSTLFAGIFCGSCDGAARSVLFWGPGWCSFVRTYRFLLLEE